MASNTNSNAGNAAKLNAALSTKVNTAEQTRRQLGKLYKDEKRVTVQGAPFYRPFFGNNMPISINGVLICVPLDGQAYDIPETFAALFQERIFKVNEQERVRKSLSNVRNNLESFAGEKDLISRA